MRRTAMRFSDPSIRFKQYSCGENGPVSRMDCRATGDVPEVHLLLLWRKLLWAEGKCGNGLPGLCCGDQPLHEELALETAPTRPRLWRRYVDDTFCILRRGSTEELLHHLNRVRKTIKFTVEWQKDGTLPFLDTQLRRREDGSLDVSIYRKPTHRDQYLHFKFHHLTNMKSGLVRCLHDRLSEIISTQDNLQKKVDHLARILKQNRYPANFICNVSAPPTRKQTQAAVMRNRRRGDHWLWYPTWLGWVRTLGVFAGSLTSG